MPLILVTRFRRKRQCVFNRPASSESCPKGRFCKSEFMSPSINTLTSPAESHESLSKSPTAWLKYRNSKSILSGPSSPKAHDDRALTQAQLARPLADGQSPSFEFKNSIATIVVSLLHPCGPYTVLWRIRAIGIIALDCVVNRWSRPQVRKKILETFFPAFTDSDSSATIPLVALIFDIQATLLHVTPSVIFSRMNAFPSTTTCD